MYSRKEELDSRLGPGMTQRVLLEACLVLGWSDTVLATAAAYRCLAARAASEVAESTEAATGRFEADSACLFLASKICEEPRRVRDVMNAVHLASNGMPLADSHCYWQLKEQVLLAEQRLLRALGFNTRTAQPHVLLLNVLRALGAPRALYDLSAALLNDGCGAGVSTAFNSRVLVAAVIGMGAAMLELPLPPGWRDVLEVNDHAVESACHALLDCYAPADSSFECEGRSSIELDRRLD